MLAGLRSGEIDLVQQTMGSIPVEDYEAVLDVPGVADRPVWVGIRPEGFILDDGSRGDSAGGILTCELSGVEVMGRDISVVSHHTNAAVTQIRSIISAENRVDPRSKTVRFSLKPYKVFLFDHDTEARIPFGASASEVK